MNNCPERAIETMHGMVIPLWYFAWSIAPPFIFTWLLRQSNVLSGLNHGWREVLYNIVWAFTFLLFSFTAYRLIHYMMRFRLFNKLVAYTSLTKYKFWRRYKAPEEY